MGMENMEKNIGAPLFSIRGLKKKFGTHEVLTGIDIDIHNGEKIAIISLLSAWGQPFT